MLTVLAVLATLAVSCAAAWLTNGWEGVADDS